MADNSYDIIVIGRGIIGGSIAWRLAERGLRVASVEAHQRGLATKAAAGMLAPLAESNSLPELAKLGIPSLEMYPTYLAELAEASGVTVPMNGPGILRVATDDAEEAQLRESFSRQSESPFKVEMLSGPEAVQLEPTISPVVQCAVLSTAEKHVVPTAVVEALTTAFKRLKVAEYSDTVMRIRRESGVWHVEATGVALQAKQIVVACGVWTRELLKPLKFDAPVTPLKGQILVMKYRRIQPPTYTVYAHSTYIVPRSQVEVMLGTTEEPEAGFEASSTSEAVASLRERGARLVPSLTEASVHKALAGLRPASPDRLPLIGRIPGLDDAFVAAGHGRNGILLAPLTANMMRDLILDGVEPPATVHPGRFAVNS